MGRSRDFRKYVIVTKKPKYDYYYNSYGITQIDDIKQNHKEELDKTFWLYTKQGEEVGRFSIVSAPDWVMEIYNILTKEQ